MHIHHNRLSVNLPAGVYWLATKTFWRATER